MSSSELLLPEVVERLAAGELPADIFASLRPPGEREVLKRATLVRAFDRALFDAVLSSGAGKADLPTFDQLVELPEVEPLPRNEGLFKVRGSARKAGWDGWWPDGADRTSLPDELRRLLNRLVDYYRANDSPVDLLAQLALIDETAALALFDELFRSAEERFDLAACQDLIDALSDPDRVRFIGRNLTAARNDRVAYLGARSLWSAEYYQTENFLEPSGLISVYQELLEGKGARVLNLHAPTGRGKTMQLRWLIARQLVPEAEQAGELPFGEGRIPCAKLDFDFVDPVNATRYPWLVLLEAAAQLNHQLPEKWFGGLLETAGWALPLLRRNPSDLSRVEAASKQIRREGARIGEETVRNFWTNLNEAAPDKPVLLVLDTLEEVHLRPQGDLVTLLDLLSEMLDRCPGLRLILAGRYDVREIVGAAIEALPPMRDLPVARFSTEEANRYLDEQRGLAKVTIRRAVVKKANGDPLLLSMLADEVQAQPKITAAELERYPAEVIRLIARIVRRIQEPSVRWILRYGVVPRSLTLEFVTDVMQPHLRQAMAGKRTLDAPQQDELPTRLGPAAAPFPTDLLESPNAPLDLEAVWAALRRYAGSTAWVFLDPSDDQVLRFPADIAIPMRGIVRRQRVFRRLHRDAAAYFERKAEQEPGQWARWTREAIYHRFQQQGPSAARFWRRALDAAGRTDPERRGAIAAELLERDYVDERRRPLDWEDGKPIVDPRTLIEAQFEHGCALSEQARARRVPPDDQLWSSAESALAAVEEGQAEQGRRVISAAGVGYLRAGLALKDGRVDEAQKELARALRTAKDGPDVARLLTLLGDAEFARGDRTAPDRYAEARRAAAGSDRSQLAEIDLKLIVSQLEFDRLGEAYDRHRRALAATHSPEERAQLHLLGALLGLGTGHLTWAEKAASAALEQGHWDAWAPRVMAPIARLEPLHARDFAAAAEAAAGTATTGALDASAQAAWARELTGVCAGELMQLDAAFATLETARSLWQSEGDADGMARCHGLSAAYKLRGVGDVRAAEYHLHAAAELELPASSDAWLEVRLVHAELHRHLGDDSEGRALIRSTVEELRKAKAPPRRLIRAAVAGLASAEPDDRRRFLDIVLAECQVVTPGSAVIGFLRGLRHVPELRDDGSLERLKKLRRLLRLDGSTRLAPPDRGVLNLTLAELERLCGNHAAALRRLATAHDQLARGGSTYFLRGWWRAVDQLGKEPAKASEPRDVESFLDEFADFPLLCAAFLVERVEAMPAARNKTAHRLLEHAGELLARDAKDETQWHARLLEARARHGRRSETLRWAGYVGAAAAIFVVLGDAARARRTERQASEEPMAELEEGRGRITLALGKDGLRVETSVPPGLVASAERHGGRAEKLLGNWARRAGPAGSFEFEDWWITDPVGVATELGALLFPPAALEAVRQRPEPLDVRLEVIEGRLDFVPWELVRAPDTGGLVALEPTFGTFTRVRSKDAVARDETRFLQNALNRLVNADLIVDDDFGPTSDTLLRSYQKKCGFEPDGIVREELLESMQAELVALGQSSVGPPLVILVQPSALRQLEGSRGMLSLGVDLGRTYEGSGFEVWRVENPSMDEIRSAIGHSLSGGRVPAVLHLCGGLRESGGATALTFLAGEWQTEALGGMRFSDELPVTAVDDLLHAFPREAFRPLVILDVDRPPGTMETIRHLFLRNSFAADLFALGRCPALIATGLVGVGAPDLYGPLIAKLASGATVGEACRELRRELDVVPTDRKLDLELTLPLAGTALFTHLPWLRPALR